MLDECKKDMQIRFSNLEKDLTRVRTGRASTSLLDGVRVDYYGTPTPLNQVASLSIPDARTIVVTPFEKKFLREIERAIQLASIGVQPNNDGSVVRLPVPPLNEERRKEIAKSIRKCGEDAKVSVRSVRQTYNTKAREQEKQKQINEDELKTLQKNIQNITDDFSGKISQIITMKEKEILTL
jgi:ribosome recycling factor